MTVTRYTMPANCPRSENTRSARRNHLTYKISRLLSGGPHGGRECQVFIAFDKAGISYSFFRQMALREGRGWPCSSYAALIST
jgi:hypothetical protein